MGLTDSKVNEIESLLVNNYVLDLTNDVIQKITCQLVIDQPLLQVVETEIKTPLGGYVTFHLYFTSGTDISLRNTRSGSEELDDFEKITSIQKYTIENFKKTLKEPMFKIYTNNLQ